MNCRTNTVAKGVRRIWLNRYFHNLLCCCGDELLAGCPDMLQPRPMRARYSWSASMPNWHFASNGCYGFCGCLRRGSAHAVSSRSATPWRVSAEKLPFRSHGPLVIRPAHLVPVPERTVHQGIAGHLATGFPHTPPEPQDDLRMCLLSAGAVDDCAHRPCRQSVHPTRGRS